MVTSMESSALNDQPSVVLRGLVKRYGSLTALDNVDLTVQQGEFFGLLGPNGAGKSTLIKLVTGLITPTAGSVSVLGLDHQNDASRIKATIGLLPEDSNLYERLTGEEFLHFAGRMYGLAESDVQDRTDQLLELLELSDKRGDLIMDYSMGMKKKVGLAAALIHNPRVLFLDEPFNGVDVISTRTVRTLLQRLVERGVTVFFSSHVMEMVERLCTRVAILKRGRIVALGSVAELKEQAGAGADRTLEEIFLAHIGESASERGLSWIG